MTPSNDNSKESVGSSADSVDQELDNTPMTTQEQFLLQALQGFILPHIGAAADANSQKEMARKLAGPHAKTLVSALKEFISSLIRTPPRTEVETTIKVALDKDENGNEQATASRMTVSVPHSVDVNAENQTLIPPKPVATISTMYDKVLVALRSHVFNKMPIRLLRFVPMGSVLEISLIERAAICEHLARILPVWPNDEYKSIRLDRWEGYRSETEDEIMSRIVEKYAKYAILSHTWLRQSPELTYGDWKGKSFDAQGPGYRKLVNFCKVAYTKHKLMLGWMDTLCINKDSSSELDESIRSMYQWYKRSEVCFVHLADTDLLAGMHRDTWFTRGWTLQELLAPSVLKFYNRHWATLVNSKNDKENNLTIAKIQEATTISIRELQNIQSVSVPLSRRMELAARRKVTREEDTAYSLMGLFNISFATAYGEGADRAFYRLLQEILNSTSDGVLDLFNCAGEDFSSTSNLLPRSPRQYLERTTDVNLRRLLPIEPLISTHMGIGISLLLMPGISIQEGNFICNPCGDYSAVVSISSPVGYNRHLPTTYALLQQHDSHSDYGLEHLGGEQYQFTFAVFNFNNSEEGIYIPSKCIAIILVGQITSTERVDRICTQEPVVFNIQKRNPRQHNSSAEDYVVPVERYMSIPQQDLAKHGMQLVFRYV